VGNVLYSWRFPCPALATSSCSTLGRKLRIIKQKYKTAITRESEEFQVRKSYIYPFPSPSPSISLQPPQRFSRMTSETPPVHSSFCSPFENYLRHSSCPGIHYRSISGTDRMPCKPPFSKLPKPEIAKSSCRNL
jgi:hypothetical protein